MMDENVTAIKLQRGRSFQFVTSDGFTQRPNFIGIWVCIYLYVFCSLSSSKDSFTVTSLPCDHHDVFLLSLPENQNNKILHFFLYLFLLAHD